MKDIRVMLFDDNLRIRESLSLMFKKTRGFEFCGAYPDNADLLENIEVVKPNVILMDIDIPVLSGIEAVHLISKKFPEIKVIMLTVFD
ncbi:MAG: response regulator transcription factor, partial [Chitinophagales bacterium]